MLINRNQLPVFFKDRQVTKEQMDQMKDIFRQAINTVNDKLLASVDNSTFQEAQLQNETSFAYLDNEVYDIQSSLAGLTQLTGTMNQDIASLQNTKASVQLVNAYLQQTEDVAASVNEMKQTLAEQDVVVMRDTEPLSEEADVWFKTF